MGKVETDPNFRIDCFITCRAHDKNTPPVYHSELIFQLKPNRGMGGEDDPYHLLELSKDESDNHLLNTWIYLSSSLIYRRAADEFFPHATPEEKDSLAVWLDDQIRVEFIDHTTLLKLKARSEDPYLARQLLSHFYGFIQKDRRHHYETIMDTTIHFLHHRIRKLQTEILEYDSVHADFLTDARSVSANAAFQTTWREHWNTLKTEEQLYTELQIALFLQEHVKSTLHQGGLLPTLSFGDSYTQSQIRRYNESWLLYNALRGKAPAHGTLQRLASEMTLLRRMIQDHLETQVRIYQTRLEQTGQQLTIQEEAFHGVSGKMAASYTNRRLLRAKLNVYVLLHLKIEEAQIKRGIYESNWKLIEPASFSPTPLRRYHKYILGFALFAGIVLPVGYYLFFATLDYRVSHSKELEKYRLLRVFETIPFPASHTDAFDRIRAELLLRWKEKKILLFTSTLPHEGKTYVARNISMSLARAGSKVILVDADMRKATQSRGLKMDSQRGVSTYLAGEDPDWKDLILPVTECNGLSLFPCGVLPPNPSELLLSERWEQLIHQLRKSYDYIIIDSVPAQLVADALVSVRVADMSFYVLKKGMIDRRYLPEINTLFKRNILPDVHLLLNGFDNPLHRFVNSAGKPRIIKWRHRMGKNHYT